MDENPVCDSSFWSPYSGNGSQCQCEQFVFGRVELSVGRLNGGRRCEIRQNVTMAWTEQLCEVFAINRPIRTNHKFLYANIAPMADTALIFVFESKLEGEGIATTAAAAVAPKILRMRTITKQTLKFIAHDVDERHAKWKEDISRVKNVRLIIGVAHLTLTTSTTMSKRYRHNGRCESNKGKAIQQKLDVKWNISLYSFRYIIHLSVRFRVRYKVRKLDFRATQT